MFCFSEKYLKVRLLADFRESNWHPERRWRLLRLTKRTRGIKHALLKPRCCRQFRATRSRIIVDADARTLPFHTPFVPYMQIAPKPPASSLRHAATRSGALCIDAATFPVLIQPRIRSDSFDKFIAVAPRCNYHRQFLPDAIIYAAWSVTEISREVQSDARSEGWIERSRYLTISRSISTRFKLRFASKIANVRHRFLAYSARDEHKYWILNRAEKRDLERSDAVIWHEKLTWFYCDLTYAADRIERIDDRD